jgi:energy-coupling factor transport system substrate-specific component
VSWLALLWGTLLFGWPLTGGQVPFLLAMAGGMVVVELHARRLDPRHLALLAAICAIDCALRLALVTGIGGFSPVYFLILLAGWAMGARFGFAAGALALATSAIVTAGVGPWLPYQMVAAGWVGMAAALVRRAGTGIWLLALTGLVTGYAFGALMDLWEWTTFYRGSPGFGFVPGLTPVETAARFLRFYLSTSVAYDTFRAVGNAAMVLLLGRPVLATLERFRERFEFQLMPTDP